jgi:hypothetical protein
LNWRKERIKKISETTAAAAIKITSLAEESENLSVMYIIVQFVQKLVYFNEIHNQT